LDGDGLLWADGTNVTGSIDFLCYNFSNATIAECDNCGFRVELGTVQCRCCTEWEWV